jgi:hypothetical protein
MHVLAELLLDIYEYRAQTEEGLKYDDPCRQLDADRLHLNMEERSQ